MNSAKKHIACLTFLLLGVILFPLGAKLAHHHDSHHYSDLHRDIPVITENEGHCLVCDFEYLPFERTGVFRLGQIGFVRYYYICSPVNNPVFEVFNFSSLRAPPLA